MYSRLAVFSLKSAHSLRSFALTARFARSTGLSALRAIEHYRGRVLNHGRACQRCDLLNTVCILYTVFTEGLAKMYSQWNILGDLWPGNF